MPLPPLYIIDFEGSVKTGIIEAGIVGFQDNTLLEHFTALYKPKQYIPLEEKSIHGLQTADCDNSLPFEADLPRYQAYRRQGLFVAHQAPYEDQLLKSDCPHPGWVDKHYEPGLTHTWGPWIDTLKLYRYFYPTLKTHNLMNLIELFNLETPLNTLTQQYCPKNRQQPHCALFDAFACMLLLSHLLQAHPTLKTHIFELVYLSQNIRKGALIDRNCTLNL